MLMFYTGKKIYIWYGSAHNMMLYPISSAVVILLSELQIVARSGLYWFGSRNARQFAFLLKLHCEMQLLSNQRS